jgi:AAA+ superfamily predicted ATPase
MTAEAHDDDRVTTVGETDGARDPIRDLVPALSRLDARLQHAAAQVPVIYGEHVNGDRYRGLYVSEADIERILAREPARPAFAGNSGPGSATNGDEATAPAGSRLAWLIDAFALTPFDVDVLVLALAPDLDLRYERLYAYLQDDLTRRRPTVDLALNLFCASASDRLVQRARFSRDAPLSRYHLIDLTVEATPTRAPLLANSIAVDPQILSYLVGESGLDPRLAGCCSLLSADGSFSLLAAEDDTTESLAAIVGAHYDRDEPVVLHFVGPRGTGKRGTAAAVAARLGRPLLVVDLTRALDGADWERTLSLARRDAWLRGAILYVHGCDAVLSADRDARRSDLESTVSAFGGAAVLSSTRAWPDAIGGEAVQITFGLPAFERQAALWREMVTQSGHQLAEDEASTLASRFRLTPRQIAVAVASASRRAEWDAVRAAPDDRATAITMSDLLAAARQGSGQDLAALASRIEPVHVWTDLVLPDDTLTQLREMCERVALRHAVMQRWGFERRFSRGKGVNALFSGSSGTGKTMAAEVIAGELGLDLFRVELAGVVSKYIGETEKNLDRIFDAAERSNGIVFFDEADALFGKRSEVHDAHDRYANIEISYLLQRMEEYDGVAILSTNLRGNLDAAFVRRLAFAVHFPFPDDAGRERIWRGVWPSEVPLDPEIDFASLAERFAVSGGSIRNIALSAAFLAARDAETVRMSHILAATRREYQKLGKTLEASDLHLAATLP